METKKFLYKSAEDLEEEYKDTKDLIVDDHKTITERRKEKVNK